MQLLRLKELIREKGTSGKNLAAEVGVTPVTISNIVKGNNFPKPELLWKIAQQLDVDIRELFIPTKAGQILNGFVEYKEKVYPIRSEKDLRELLDLMNKEQ